MKDGLWIVNLNGLADRLMESKNLLDVHKWKPVQLYEGFGTATTDHNQATTETESTHAHTYMHAQVSPSDFGT